MPNFFPPAGGRFLDWEKIDMELSEIIKTIRSELNLSQEGLARELHVGFSSVNRWENNKSKPNQIAEYILIDL